MNLLKISTPFAICIVLSACQTTARLDNGLSGYNIESKSNHSAILSYTLADNRNPQKEQLKLQSACQQVLGKQKTYQIEILSTNTIVAPSHNEQQQNIRLGESKTSFGLSNTQGLNSDNTIAINQALETRPSTLKVIRYSCK